MRQMKSIVQCLLLVILMFSAGFAYAQKGDQAAGTVTHIVLVWLKDPGNAEMRKEFIEASKTLNNLPGIINRHVGEVLPSDRILDDDTYDVGVSVTLKNERAYKDYMAHPKHKKVVAEKLKPLVNRAVAYTFISK
jgi:Stress responsive A/B Barrel Domain